MNPKRLIFLLAAFMALHGAIVLLLPPPTGASDLTTQNILSAINKERVARNLPALNENNLLDAAAVYKANDMQARHYFAHVDPDGRYIWDKIVSLGYSPYMELGENLAINFYDTESLTDAWMQSPEHRANILNNGFRDQGMGVNLGNVQQGQYYSAIANTFGTLAVKQQAQVAANSTATQTPKPKTTTPAPKTTTPIAVTTPSTTPVLAVRGTRQLPTTTPPATQTTVTIPAASQNPPPPVLPNGAVVNTSNPLTSAQANRYLSLVFGILILGFLGRDSWSYIKEKGAHLDKKINNLVLLILALIAVGLMYWL